jgi:hypothetical protein
MFTLEYGHIDPGSSRQRYLAVGGDEILHERSGNGADLTKGVPLIKVLGADRPF